MSDTTTVVVDPDLCVGSGFCRAVTEAIFAGRPDDVVALQGPDGLTDGPITVPPDLIDLVREAAAACPAQAIILEGQR